MNSIPIHRRVQFRTDWGEVMVDTEKILGFTERPDGRIRITVAASDFTETIALITTWEAVRDFERLVRESKERNG